MDFYQRRKQLAVRQLLRLIAKIAHRRYLIEYNLYFSSSAAGTHFSSGVTSPGEALFASVMTGPSIAIVTMCKALFITDRLSAETTVECKKAFTNYRFHYISPGTK